MKTHMIVDEFILEYFEGKTKKNKVDIKRNVNYFKEDYIDSVGVFDLISALESRFNFEFNNDDFQDRDFVTIEGLSKIIMDKGIAL